MPRSSRKEATKALKQIASMAAGKDNDTIDPEGKGSSLMRRMGAKLKETAISAGLWPQKRTAQKLLDPRSN